MIGGTAKLGILALHPENRKHNSTQLYTTLFQVAAR